jgi:hypothetical protein
MSFKKGDRVVVVADNARLRKHNCDENVVTGAEFTYMYESPDTAGGFIDTGGCRNHVRHGFITLVDDYSDEDWV